MITLNLSADNIAQPSKLQPQKALQKIKNYFRKQAFEPLQGLLCQNCPRQQVLFAKAIVNQLDLGMVNFKTKLRSVDYYVSTAEICKIDYPKIKLKNYK
jgi:hypothetical protein